MPKQYFSLRNLKFTLHEVHESQEITQYPYFSHIDREAIDMILDSAIQIADNILAPVAIEMDREHMAHFHDGKVTVHPAVKKYIKAVGDAGLIASRAPLEVGGSQLPETLNVAIAFVMGAANNAITAYAGLSEGASNLILSFGSQYLKDTYLQKMYAGDWQGTMCLTEPQAGSSLHYITSSALPTDEAGKYKIKGQKIYITAGDHDQTDNVVHLYLARIDGAPAGTKGISLFVVPQKRVENGQFVPNDVKTIGIFHKMGQKGCPAVHIEAGNNDECYGWLLGEANKGLTYMFQMMNEARIGVGTTGACIASAAYYAALEYANERPQGQLLNVKGQDPNAPQTLIINHPDVKRMLMLQKAITEGSLSLIMQGAKYADLLHVSEGEDKEKYQLLLDFLTPVIKTYPTEAGIQSVSSSLQVFGGGGFCEDFPLEKLYRDIRITTIYEGTTGIQSLALLGRNITMKNGKAAMLFFQEVMKDIEASKTHEDLKKYANTLASKLAEVQRVTQHLVGFAMKGETERFLADATLYMEMFGIITIAWQWLKQATVAKNALLTQNPQGDDLQFYESKVHSMRFYFAYELPKTLGLAVRLLDDELLTIGVENTILV